MEYHDLLKVCKSMSICVTEKMAESVEAATRDQSCGTNIEQAESLHQE